MRELILEGPLLRKRRVKKLILIGVDACLITISYLLAILFRYYMEGSSVNETVAILGNFKWGFMLSLGIFLLCQWMMKQYQSIWTLAGIEDFTLGMLAFIGGTILNLMISLY